MQGLDVIKEHTRAFKKLQNVGRSTKKISILYEQYFLYFFKLENSATSYHSGDRPLTFAAHCNCSTKVPYEMLMKEELQVVMLFNRNRYNINFDKDIIFKSFLW